MSRAHGLSMVQPQHAGHPQHQGNFLQAQGQFPPQKGRFQQHHGPLQRGQGQLCHEALQTKGHLQHPTVQVQQTGAHFLPRVPPSPPHRWLRAELDSARLSHQAEQAMHREEEMLLGVSSSGQPWPGAERDQPSTLPEPAQPVQGSQQQVPTTVPDSWRFAAAMAQKNQFQPQPPPQIGSSAPIHSPMHDSWQAIHSAVPSRWSLPRQAPRISPQGCSWRQQALVPEAVPSHLPVNSSLLGEEASHTRHAAVADTSGADQHLPTATPPHPPHSSQWPPQQQLAFGLQQQHQHGPKHGEHDHQPHRHHLPKQAEFPLQQHTSHSFAQQQPQLLQQAGPNCPLQQRSGGFDTNKTYHEWSCDDNRHHHQHHHQQQQSGDSGAHQQQQQQQQRSGGHDAQQQQQVAHMKTGVCQQLQARACPQWHHQPPHQASPTVFHQAHASNQVAQQHTHSMKDDTGPGLSFRKSATLPDVGVVPPYPAAPSLPGDLTPACGPTA